jgi:hypothetical protein
VVLICSSKEFVTTVPFPRTPTYSMYDSHAHPVPSDSPSDWSCASGIARESKYWLVGVIAGFVPILLMLDSTVWVPTWFWDQYTILQIICIFTNPNHLMKSLQLHHQNNIYVITSRQRTATLTAQRCPSDQLAAECSPVWKALLNFEIELMFLCKEH